MTTIADKIVKEAISKHENEKIHQSVLFTCHTLTKKKLATSDHDFKKDKTTFLLADGSKLIISFDDYVVDNRKAY